MKFAEYIKLNEDMPPSPGMPPAPPGAPGMPPPPPGGDPMSMGGMPGAAPTGMAPMGMGPSGMSPPPPGGQATAPIVAKFQDVWSVLKHKFDKKNMNTKELKADKKA